MSDLPLWIEMYARFAKASGYGLYAICLGQIRAKNNKLGILQIEDRIDKQVP
jgi:hypothetical protein